jgi:hypothetical protein
MKEKIKQEELEAKKMKVVGKQKKKETAVEIGL